MDDSADLYNSQYHNINIIDDLKIELQKFHSQFPHRFPKPIHVLPAICTNVDSQWKQQLRQVKQDQAGEHIVFIPYNIENFLWTGIFIKFQANGQAEQAILIDPVISLNILLLELQEQFSITYPEIIIRSKNIQTYANREHHASMIVANLVRGIEEAQLSEVQSSFTNHFNSSTCLSQEANVTISVPSQSNNATNFHSVERLNSNLTSLQISNVSEQLEKERKFSFHSSDDMKFFSTVPQLNGALNQDVISDLKDEKYPIIEEILRNLYDDFSSMPLCAERCLYSLIFQISLNLTDIDIVLHYTNVMTSLTEIQNEFECLKERLKIEEFETVDMQNFIEAAFISIKRQNWKATLVNLQKMLEYINPLKINQLFRLVKKGNNTVDLMKGKDVIIFLGGSREDKSAIIHFLTESKINNSHLKKIIKINLKDSAGFSNETVILCDGFGFENTNKPEVDMANTIGIMKALQGCKSVKLVILVSYESISDQLSSLKDLLKTLVRIIPGIEKYIKTFSYIYTKFPSKEKNGAYELLANLKETISQVNKADSDFMNLFTDMLCKTEKRPVVLDPINDDPLEVLEDLIQSSAIKHPDEVFHFSMTENSKIILKKQTRIHYTSILSATKRAEYEFVRYKLNQLKILNDLVDQAYIRQIYSDCIDYISRHLLDNYQKGTSSLNRCLFNQTVLNNEDIHQYKICIDHAKLAEQLRKDHLADKVVHSNAFIEYLNEQIDILLVDLKDKDINDVLVKQTLDKIKLISNSFYDIDVNKYRDICEVFSIKFKSIIKSFETSVLSNEFDKSAKDITRVSQALIILNTHLDDKHMEIKYKQMQEYFLKYLNDSIEKMNHMFITEKLNESDIDSLKSCVNMLETAKITFNLHSNISKEMIDRISERFLLKIEVYFEDIAKTIHTGIQNKNSFHSLAKLMNELDSIRTISIIEQKTNQSYCSILEKLVEYLYESTRHVEEFLRGLIQRQEKVSYYNLRKSSSILNEAQWIKKYRASAYSYAMHTIEELVLQYIQEMKESVMEINLDLDSYDRIDLVQKILSGMNEMKYFETIVPEVSQHLVEVHIYVNKSIDNLCTVIKDSFSIEIWKEHGCPIVNLSKAESAFHYLNIYRKIHIQWKTDYVTVYNSLKEFIKQYSDCIQDKMKDCFEKIKQYPNINKEDLFAKVHILSNRLQEISEVKNKYPQVFSYFSNQKSFEQWQEELSSDVIELEIQMEKLHITQQAVLLNQKLLMLKALSKLDSFLKGEKYIDIYHKYQSIAFLQMKNIFEEVLNAIRQDDYETVAYEIVKLPLSDDIGQFFSVQFKRSLRVRLDDLIDETKMQAILLGDSLKLEQIKSIVKNLKRIQKAKRFVSEYLDADDELNILVEEVKKLIEERINRFLERIKAVIIINDFSEFERRIDSIVLVCTVLGNYCSNRILNEIEKLKERQYNVVLKEIIEKYSEMDISEYFFHPPIYIFAKFEEVINIDSKYVEVFNKIKQIIFLKFRKELEQSKLKESRDKKIIHLRRFESAVKYLPETIRNALEIELKHHKDDIALLNQDIRFNQK